MNGSLAGSHARGVKLAYLPNVYTRSTFQSPLASRHTDGGGPGRSHRQRHLTISLATWVVIRASEGTQVRTSPCDLGVAREHSSVTREALSSPPAVQGILEICGQCPAQRAAGQMVSFFCRSGNLGPNPHFSSWQGFLTENYFLPLYRKCQTW